LFGCPGGRGFYNDPTKRGISCGIASYNPRSDHGLGGCGSFGRPHLLCRLNDGLELPKDDNAFIALLEPGSYDLKLNVLSLLHPFKVRVANVEVTRKEHLERSQLGMNTDLALESHRHAEGLPRVRHAYIRLELYGIIKTSLNEVGASKGVLHDSDASVQDVSLGNTDSFKLVTKLSEKTCFNIALQILGIQMNISDESTTFKERIAHTVCSY
jgi:hypothetical protein